MRADDHIGTLARRRCGLELIADIAETEFMYDDRDTEFRFEIRSQFFKNWRPRVVRPDDQSVVLRGYRDCDHQNEDDDRN